MMKLQAVSFFVSDSFGRIHSDLRISVTDRCNLRCSYCMPENGAKFVSNTSLLTFSEIESFVDTAVELGFNKLRITGGEPLLRPNLPDLVASLAVKPLDDLALTTNGVLLAHHASALYWAGLRRLNVHLDTLDSARFRQIARRDDLDSVLHGIELALKAGFHVKLNAVAMKNFSEPDIIPLARYARARDIELRFIEFMPLDGQSLWDISKVLSASEIAAIVESEFGPLTPVPDADPGAPATEYRYADGKKISFVASVTRPFCGNCNRLRLTSDGKLRSCLFACEETNIRHLIGQPSMLGQAIRECVLRKLPGHQMQSPAFVPPPRPMYSIGG